ncbi:MAG: hypothetical protein E7321_00195 [Clostridiales bacterium]|nr:hypothetical protein [Clostridiales bacterium]
MKKSRWQLADDNFREQIDLLMVRMHTKNKADVADAAGIKRNSFYNRYEHPRTLRVFEMRLLSILFEKHGMVFDQTMGEGAAAA